MAINSIITHTCDLTKKQKRVIPLDHMLVMGDDKGDRFEVTVTSDGKPVSLSGASVTGYFLRSADGSTIPIPGTASGSVASVVLPEACYTLPGRFALTVKVSLGGSRHAVYVCEGSIFRSTTDSIIDPGHNIPDLEELLAMLDQMEQATDAAKKATTEANAATSSANTAAGKATTAAGTANTAAGKADTAAKGADAAAQKAASAAAEASTAAQQANTAKNAANEAAGAANAAAKAVGAVAEQADAAREQALEAAREGNAAAAKAGEAAARATDAAVIAEHWGSVEVAVTMGEPDTPPLCTVTDTETGKVMAFELPRGLTGLTPRLTLGEVLTGEPGSEVQAWFTGSDEEPVLNLQIPRGDVGSIETLTVCGIAPDETGNVPLTAEAVGARRDDWTPTAEEVGARPDSWTPTAEEIGALPDDAPVVKTVNGEAPDENGDVQIETCAVLDAYPVGSIYMSLEETSPAALFGGSWTAISGKFLIAANDSYAAGSTGGAASVTSGGSSAANTGGTSLTTGGSSAANAGATTLTVDQIPEHKHIVATVNESASSENRTSITNQPVITAGNYYKTERKKDGIGEGNDKVNATGGGKSHTHTIAHTHSISSHTHTMAHTHSVSTMPPYYAVYMWRRTA